jgi:uncharacterized caspase-like protein
MRQLLFILSVCFVLFVTDEANARRVALVIGNSNYLHIGKLVNPANDAILIAKTLEEKGFEVELVLNAEQAIIKRSMIKYSRKLTADVEIGFFYYAGHAIQVGGENYIIPIEADISADDEVDLQAVGLSGLLRTLAATKSSVNVVVMDACRNNPIKSFSRDISGGLATVIAPKGTFVAFSTSPGAVAEDGEEQNSTYTKSLAASIANTNLKLEDVFKLTRVNVAAELRDKQIPWDSSSVIGDFYFVPNGASANLSQDYKPECKSFEDFGEDCRLTKEQVEYLELLDRPRPPIGEELSRLNKIQPQKVDPVLERLLGGDW